MPYHEDNLRESRLRPEREPEAIITPDHSPDAQVKIEKINQGIEASEELLGGLGRLARREGIITDPEAWEKIYAPEEIRQDLGKYDADAFESAGRGLKIINKLTLGLVGRKHVLEGYGEKKVDTRKLKDDAHGRQSLRYSSELEDAIKTFGLDPNQSHSWQDFRKEYVKGEKGAEKIFMREKTMAEADKIAGNIFAKQLKDLETEDGANLIKQKENLEEFQKEKDQHKSILDEASLNKLENEAIARQELISQKQEDLNSNLEIIRSPLLEQRENLAQALEGFSSLLKETDGQEKIYLNEIKVLQEKITKISGTKQLKEILGDEIKEWEQEKKQTQANLEDFKKTKDALNKRIIELKKNQTEVDATLTRINNIGKTKEELRAEKAEKLQEEKRQKEASEAEKKNVDPAAVMAPAMSVESGGDGSDEAVEVAGETKARPASSQTVEKKSKTKAKKPKIEVDATAAPERQRGAKPEKTEEIKLKVVEWLSKLKIGGIDPDPEAMNTIKRYFKLSGQEYDRTASMTLDQAKTAYRGYLVERSELTSMNSIEQRVNEDFKKIIKDLEE